ncbi:methyltransferase, TIGR04325 family [Alcanivorax sp.]|uniref:methyltransferase, TIGR04325 family n=1 Tax=Alcanivorax sp. TaxID=1872427 RepID=UPI0025846941|nr:methyltransferase, TIGR04325 family [Alcanivorax sp.]
MLQKVGVRITRTPRTGVPEGCVFFSGDYASWNEAMQDSKGYDDPSILEKVRDAALQVKMGKAEYERDSVLFDRIEYSWPVLAALLWTAANNEGKLSVLDFGGSLGTSYFQNRKFLGTLPHVRWGVVEQPHFIEIGKRDFQDDRLMFFPTIEDAMVNIEPRVALLSGVLQCLDDPYGWLNQILQHELETVIVDVFPVLEGESDRLTVEHVPSSIYEASYPAWFFNKDKFLGFVRGRGYELVEEFEAYVGDTLYLSDGKRGRDVGFVFRRRDA